MTTGKTFRAISAALLATAATLPACRLLRRTEQALPVQVPRVVAVAGPMVTVNVGSEEGLQPGAELLVAGEGTRTCRLRVEKVWAHTATGRLAAGGVARVGDAVRVAQPDAPNPAATTGERLVGPNGRIEARVLAVKGDLASINAGSDQGLEPAAVMIVHRRGRFVAHLKLTDVGAGLSVGELLNQALDPQAGDRAITGP